MIIQDAICTQKTGIKVMRNVPDLEVDLSLKMSGTLRFAKDSQCLSRQSGLTLLEIMITIVILSLGLLGLAGLQLTGLKNNRNAYYNTLAGQSVQDISERLRVDQVTRNAITGVAKSISADATKCAANIADNFDNRVACLASALPEGTARVSERNSNPKTLYIALTWADIQLDGAKGWGSGTTANSDTRPDASACGEQQDNRSCYYVVFRP